MTNCVGCGSPGKFSIMLAVALNPDDSIHYHLPNQIARNHHSDIREVWFCKKCMRYVEDNLRASILYLQYETKATDQWIKARSS